MSITKTAAALIAAAIAGAAVAPAQAQSMAPTYSYGQYGQTGGWINSANRDFYTPGYAPGSTTDGYAAATDDYARAGCTTARVRVRLADGRTVTRLRRICP